MKKKAICCILVGSMVCSGSSVILAAEHSPFSDLSSDAWCYGYITSMVGHGFLSGYPDHSFRPDALITRAETAVALSRLGLPAILKEKAFVDVQSHTWFYGPILQAYRSGAMLGTNHDTTGDYFAPNAYLTRSDAAILASRLYGFQRNYSGVNLRQFRDHTEIAYGARPHIQNLIKAGILSGYPDGTIRANQPITRAEFSRIFNFICHIPSEEMRRNLEDALETDAILNEQTALSEVSIELVVADSLVLGEASAAKVKLVTENIPDGTEIPLFLSNNSGGLTIPQSVTIYNNTAVFSIYSTPFTANTTYVLTAEYEGLRFSENVYLEQRDTVPLDAVIENIIVSGTLKHGRRDAVEVTVETKDIPDGEYLTAAISGAGLSLADDTVAVRNNKAVFTVESDMTVATGVYTFRVGYEGHYREASVVVSETWSDDPYILDVSVSRNLTAGKNDQIRILVRTNGLPNGQSMTAALLGGTGGIYPAAAGITVSDTALVYNDQAEFVVYSSDSTPAGTYYVELDYNGHTQRVRLTVSEAKDAGEEGHEPGTIRDMETDGYLYEVDNDYARVRIWTRGIPDGTRLYPQSEGGLEVPYSCEVYRDYAEFYVYNPDFVAAGRYDITIAYGGEVYTAAVRVRG